MDFIDNNVQSSSVIQQNRPSAAVVGSPLEDFTGHCSSSSEPTIFFFEADFLGFCSSSSSSSSSSSCSFFFDFSFMNDLVPGQGGFLVASFGFFEGVSISITGFEGRPRFFGVNNSSRSGLGDSFQISHHGIDRDVDLSWSPSATSLPLVRRHRPSSSPKKPTLQGFSAQPSPQTPQFQQKSTTPGGNFQKPQSPFTFPGSSAYPHGPQYGVQQGYPPLGYAGQHNSPAPPNYAQQNF
ncbi:hypothetical protein EG329_009421 [Mollisiaceae sp. DMI_Dod_QoI]|nr:hypothetical protein EG329_009421 [Helotiales sp. DMI_Dod_QoI]